MGIPFEKRYGKYYESLADTDAYLRRMGVKKEDVTITKKGLDMLQKAHLFSVPFENIDLFDYDQPVDFGIAELYDKIVTRHRGGYCFELNAIFMALLQNLGFDVYAAGGRLLFGSDAEPGGKVSAISHRVSIVTIDGKRHVSDVGFGSTAAPLVSVCIDDYGEQDIAGEIYSVEDRAYNNKIVIRHTETGPSPFMMFVPDPTPIVDFVSLNYHIARTGFRFKRMANLRSENGTMSIDGAIFREAKNGVFTETPIPTANDARRILTERYGMILDDRPLQEKAELEMQ